MSSLDPTLHDLDVNERHIAVGSGQYCERFAHERINVVDVSSSRPLLLWDGHVAKSAREHFIEDLGRRAARVRVVEVDTMARNR